jgi:hypothetical protein
MKIFDTIKTVNHILTTHFPTNTLMDVQLPSKELAPLPHWHIREYKNGRWMRVDTRPEKPGEFPELPDEFVKLLEEGRLLELRELYLCWDQASWDVSCGQFFLEPAPGTWFSYHARHHAVCSSDRKLLFLLLVWGAFYFEPRRAWHEWRCARRLLPRVLERV